MVVTNAGEKVSEETEASGLFIQPKALQVCFWELKTKTHIKSIFKIL